MRKNIVQMEERIGQIKLELQGIGPMRPGSLTHQYQKPKEKKGGYYQISYTHQMKSRTEYVRKEMVKLLETQIATFRRFKSLTQEWIDLAIQHSKLSMELAKKRSKKLP